MADLGHMAAPYGWGDLANGLSALESYGNDTHIAYIGTY